MSVDKSAPRVRQMFGEIAERYDFLNHFLSLGIDRYWRWRTVRLVPPESDHPVLDTCTGTGDLALAFHRATSEMTPVIGTDFARPMLRIAKKKGETAKANSAPATLDFLEADSERLPFHNDTFQIVSVAFGLRNVSDLDAGLREMVRVCRPGGRVAVLEFALPDRWPMRPIYAWYFDRVLPRIGNALARNRQAAYNYLPASVREFPQKEALVERLCAAGLSRVRYVRFTFGIAVLYLGMKSDSCLSPAPDPAASPTQGAA